jgi:hypothetical protein
LNEVMNFRVAYNMGKLLGFSRRTLLHGVMELLLKILKNGNHLSVVSKLISYLMQNSLLLSLKKNISLLLSLQKSIGNFWFHKSSRFVT